MTTMVAHCVETESLGWDHVYVVYQRRPTAQASLYLERSLVFLVNSCHWVAVMSSVMRVPHFGCSFITPFIIILCLFY